MASFTGYSLPGFRFLSSFAKKNFCFDFHTKGGCKMLMLTAVMASSMLLLTLLTNITKLALMLIQVLKLMVGSALRMMETAMASIRKSLLVLILILTAMVDVP